MILVTGATGNIGSELLRLLAETETPVRAVSRKDLNESSRSDATSDASNDPPDIEWARADLADREAVPPLMDDIDRVFLLSGNAANMVRVQKNVIRAAAAAGVDQIVKVSALGASDHSKSVIGVWHFVIEHELEQSGLSWTILRPHVFMQNLLDQKESILRDGRVFSPSASAAIPMIDTRDVAAVAASCLTRDGHGGQTYTLSGPAPLSYAEAAGILGRVLGREIKYVPETEPEAFLRLHNSGLPAWMIGAQLALAEYQRAGGGTDIVTDSVAKITGRPARNFETFARDHVDEFGRA